MNLLNPISNELPHIPMTSVEFGRIGKAVDNFGTELGVPVAIEIYKIEGIYRLELKFTLDTKREHE